MNCPRCSRNFPPTHPVASATLGGYGGRPSAAQPIVFAASLPSHPSATAQLPWGEKALTGYLGGDRETWRAYDATALIEDGARADAILVDQGDADGFLTDQLKPELLEAACASAGIDLTLRMQAGYDHSYYFISTFLADHVAWHATRLHA